MELRMFLDHLDVINCQADHQVHDHDAHHQDKDDEDENGVILKRGRVRSLVKKTLELKLSNHHHEGFEYGPARRIKWRIAYEEKMKAKAEGDEQDCHHDDEASKR